MTAGHMPIDEALHRELQRIAGSTAPARDLAARLRPLQRQQQNTDAPPQRALTHAGASRMMQTPSPPPVVRVPLSVCEVCCSAGFVVLQPSRMFAFSCAMRPSLCHLLDAKPAVCIVCVTLEMSAVGRP